MSWRQLELRVAAEQLAQAEALLGLLGATSVTLSGAGPDEILEPAPGSAPLWPVTIVRALFPVGVDVERAAAVLAESLAEDTDIVASSLDDHVWREALCERPRELPIGARLLITGAGGASRPTERVVVRLNRGLGFGTGDHPTTRLCLEWLEAALSPGASVVDFGCGSGILALAALCLGATRAWAVDIEPQALEATTANAALNGLTGRLWVGAPEVLPVGTADVILANVLAGPLIELAPRFARLVEPRGTVVLAGILAEQYSRVAEVYSRHFAQLARRDRDAWTSIVASRPIR